MTITQMAFAKQIGVTRGRVSQMIKEGIIEREPGGGLDPIKCEKQWRDRRSYVQIKEKPKTKKEKNAHDRLVESRAGVMELKAEKEQLLVDEMKKRLIDKDVFIAEFSRVLDKAFAAINSKLVALPKQLALEWPDPKQKAIVEAKATEVVNNCREDLANIKLEGKMKGERR